MLALQTLYILRSYVSFSIGVVKTNLIHPELNIFYSLWTKANTELCCCLRTEFWWNSFGNFFCFCFKTFNAYRNDAATEFNEGQTKLNISFKEGFQCQAQTKAVNSRKSPSSTAGKLNFCRVLLDKTFQSSSWSLINNFLARKRIF